MHAVRKRNRRAMPASTIPVIASAFFTPFSFFNACIPIETAAKPGRIVEKPIISKSNAE